MNKKKNILAIGSLGKQKLTVWNITTGNQITDFSASTMNSKAITAIAFDELGSKLLIGDSKGRIYGWNP